MLDVSQLGLVDHHCHGVVRHPLDRPTFESYLTESDRPAPEGLSRFDSQLGLAVRRWCPPLLGLDPHSPPEAYLERRAELAPEKVTRRLLLASGISDYLVDTGLDGDLTGPPELAAASGARAHEVVRLEAAAEAVLREGTSATGFASAFADALHEAARTAVAVKSVVAYRHGLDVDPAPPAAAEVAAAAGAWLAAAARTASPRLADPVLLRHVLWAGIDTGLPLQVHTGFGDPDLTLHRADPALLTPFLRAASRVDVVLLHGYPYHRNAAYLAHVFPHVYVDVGLALSHVGARAGAVLAEILELAPFGKVLFSTDAYGLPELYVVGAALFREHLGRVLNGWIADGACTAGDAERIAHLVASENARRVYRIG